MKKFKIPTNFSNPPPSQITFRGDILQLHILYLKKFEKLSKEERKAFSTYLLHLATPMMEVKDIKIPEDFFNIGGKE